MRPKDKGRPFSNEFPRPHPAWGWVPTLPVQLYPDPPSARAGPGGTWRRGTGLFLLKASLDADAQRGRPPPDWLWRHTVTGEKDTFPTGHVGAAGHAPGPGPALVHGWGWGWCAEGAPGGGGVQRGPPHRAPTYCSHLQKRAGVPAFQAPEACPTRELAPLSTWNCWHMRPQESLGRRFPTGTRGSTNPGPTQVPEPPLCLSGPCSWKGLETLPDGRCPRVRGARVPSIAPRPLLASLLPTEPGDPNCTCEVTSHRTPSGDPFPGPEQAPPPPLKAAEEPSKPPTPGHRELKATGRPSSPPLSQAGSGRREARPGCGPSACSGEEERRTRSVQHVTPRLGVEEKCV